MVVVSDDEIVVYESKPFAFRGLSYYEPQAHMIKSKSQFLDLDGLLALLPSDDEREPSSIEIMPDREVYIGGKPATSVAQESLMSECAIIRGKRQLNECIRRRAEKIIHADE